MDGLVLPGATGLDSHRVDSDPLPALARAEPLQLGAAGAFGVPSSVLASLQAEPALSGAAARPARRQCDGNAPTARRCDDRNSGRIRFAVSSTPGGQ